MINSSNSASRAIFSSSEDIGSFVDIPMAYVKPIEREIIGLFARVVERAIGNTGDEELFSLTRTMQMMIADDETLHLQCLQSEDLGGNEKRSELAQMIDLMVRGNKKEYADSFQTSTHDSVNALWNMLNSTEYEGKSHSGGGPLLEKLTLLKNFTLRLIVDLVEKNHALFNEEEKSQWLGQVSEEPNKLFEEFLKKDQKMRADLAAKIAVHEKRKLEGVEENNRKKSRKIPIDHERAGASDRSEISTFASNNAVMLYPSLPFSLEGSTAQSFEQLSIGASPSSSPKNSSKRNRFAETLGEYSRGKSPEKKEESFSR